MNKLPKPFAIALILTLAFITLVSYVSRVVACPFCDAVAATYTQDMDVADMTVMAKLVKRPDDSKENNIDANTEEFPKATFEIYHILKGEKHCKVGTKLKAFYMGDAKVGAKFLINGQATAEQEWDKPNPLKDSTEAYLLDLVQFPKDPGERMVRMQKYLASADKSVNVDALSEFAAVDVRELVKVKGKLSLEQIRKIVADPKTESSLMGLNYSLLGICGTQADVPFLEERLSKGDDLQMKRLDALIGSYLMLTKEVGLETVDKKILSPALEKRDIPRVKATLIALQYHGDDGFFIPKEKVARVVAKFLDYPEYADFVILDLSRWGHWESADRIMKIARENPQGVSPWIRELAIQYAVNYLKADQKSEKIKDFLIEMKKVDPASFKRAAIYSGGAPKSPKPNANDADMGKTLDLEAKPAAAEPNRTTSVK